MKKIVCLLLVAVVCMTCIPTLAFAEGNDDSAKEAVGYIYGDPIITPAHNVGGVARAAATTRASCPNYAESNEYVFLYYSGYLQFQPSYLTQSGDGSGLQAGKHVAQGSIDYRRGGVSVSGGRQYTTMATSKYDTNIYSVSTSCWDDPITWGEEGTTDFYRWWTYFA